AEACAPMHFVQWIIELAPLSGERASQLREFGLTDSIRMKWLPRRPAQFSINQELRKPKHRI
ncbi:MAG: hypothetical protein WBC13_11980, partial [Dokdonella sp.]